MEGIALRFKRGFSRTARWSCFKSAMMQQEKTKLIRKRLTGIISEGGGNRSRPEEQ
jgi:hypothetical protein